MWWQGSQSPSYNGQYSTCARGFNKWWDRQGQNIVSDSPTSQYRNKHMFWLPWNFCVERKKVEFKWIYLKSGHGKGVPDGIGATVKKPIKNILIYNPDDAIYTVDDLLQCDLHIHVPSIKSQIHTSEDFEKESLPYHIYSKSMEQWYSMKYNSKLKHKT